MALSVPTGLQVVAVGDLHGQLALLDRFLARVTSEVVRPELITRIVFLGDFVDRGPDSAGVLERLSKQPEFDFECVFIRGNHDQWFLDVLEGKLSSAEPFIRFGGRATAASYKVSVPLKLDKPALELLITDLRQAVPSSHVAFLRSTQLRVTIGDYLFCHAGIRPGVPLEGQRASDLLSIREPFLSSHCPLENMCVVHGHSITPKAENLPHRLGLDVGAYATNQLAAAILSHHDRQVFYTNM